MHTYIYIYIYIHPHTCIYTYIGTCVALPDNPHLFGASAVSMQLSAGTQTNVPGSAGSTYCGRIYLYIYMYIHTYMCVYVRPKCSCSCLQEHKQTCMDLRDPHTANVCVCIYIYICIYIHIYIYLCVYIYTYIYTYTYIYIYQQVHTQAHARTHAHKHQRVHKQMCPDLRDPHTAYSHVHIHTFMYPLLHTHDATPSPLVLCTYHAAHAHTYICSHLQKKRQSLC